MGWQATVKFIGENCIDFVFAAVDTVEQYETGTISCDEASTRKCCLSLWRYAHREKCANILEDTLDIVDWYLNRRKIIELLRRFNIRMRAETRGSLNY
jgi:hypothetical protein